MDPDDYFSVRILDLLTLIFLAAYVAMRALASRREFPRSAVLILRLERRYTRRALGFDF
jgi:hypothetical protein